MSISEAQDCDKCHVFPVTFVINWPEMPHFSHFMGQEYLTQQVHLIRLLISWYPIQTNYEELFMSTRNSVDHATMRDMNLALILNTIRFRAPLSRADLAATTGLNKATVSSLVKDLLRAGWVCEGGIDNSTAEVGRPAINLEPNPEAGYFIGAEIGVNFISVIIANFAMQIVSRRYESTGKLFNQDAILDRLLYLLGESREQIMRTGKPLFGIGVGVPGLVDVSTGKLIVAPNLGWHDVPLGQIIKNAFAEPIYVANEANLAALGESYFGAGQDITYMLYVSSGIGLGGGIVANGRLEEGATGFAGEVGHMIVDRHGLRCNCGSYGCWETVAGEKALFDRVKPAIHENPEGLLAQMTGGDPERVTLAIISRAADKGDPAACAALQETAEWLGIGISSLINILNPQRVVFGGPLSVAHEHLLPIIKKIVQERSWKWVHEQATIVIAEFGEDASVMGGVAMVYRELLNQPRQWLNSVVPVAV
jgi:glucokinase-like ROK family protein